MTFLHYEFLQLVVESIPKRAELQRSSGMSSTISDERSLRHDRWTRRVHGDPWRRHLATRSRDACMVCSEFWWERERESQVMLNISYLSQHQIEFYYDWYLKKYTAPAVEKIFLSISSLAGAELCKFFYFGLLEMSVFGKGKVVKCNGQQFRHIE